MAISDLDVKEIFQGDAVTTDFAIPFAFILNASIRVVERDETDPAAPVETLAVLGVDYNFDDPNAPTLIQFVSAPASTTKVLVRRLSIKDQPIDFLETSKFPSETNETGLDHGVLLNQEACEKLDRTLTFPETSPTSSIEMAEPAADKFFQWNPAGDGIIYKTAAEIATLSVATDLDILLGAFTATIVNNQAAPANVTSWTLDSATSTSAIYLVEWLRPADTDLINNEIVWLHFVEGAWRIDRLIATTDDIDGAVPAGITLTLSGTTVAQVQYTSTDLTGGTNGTAKVKKIPFAI